MNLEHAKLLAQKQELSAKLSAMESRLSAISLEITKLSSTGIDRILEAIKNQRWYFFKNKTQVFMDKNSGLLWANLRYYNCCKDYNMVPYKSTDDISILSDLNLDGYMYWRLPTKIEFCDIMNDATMPFRSNANHYVKLQNGNNSCAGARVSDIGMNGWIWLDQDYPGEISDSHDVIWFPCSSILSSSIYVNNISNNNPNYTEKERLQFTLDLFVQNDLWSIFDDEEITGLYKKIYCEKPCLLEQLQELQTQIESLQTVILLSSTFDYTALLAKYDIEAIDASIIKYYQAVQ